MPNRNPKPDIDLDDMFEKDYRKEDTEDSTQGRTQNSPDVVTDSVTEDGNKGGIESVIDSQSKRPTKRHPFDFYVDQLDVLDEIDLESRKKTGKQFNKSAYVREALDLKLKKDNLLKP